MVSGDNSILSKATTAKTKTKEKNKEEQIKLEVIGSIGTNGKIDVETLKTNLGKMGATASENELPLTVTLDDEEYIVDTNGNVTKVEVTDPAEDLLKLKQYFIGKGYSDFREDINNLDSNFVNNEIIPDASTSIQPTDYGIKYHNRKYEIIGDGEGNEYVVTDVEDITGMTIVINDMKVQHPIIKFIPKNNQT